MGIVEAIVSDNLISEFKLNVVKREGSTLGAFSSAVEQAMQLWIKNDEVEEIKQSVLKIITSAHFADETKPLIDALKSKGKDAIPALNEIVRSGRLHSDEEEYVGNAIKEIMKA